MRVISTSKGCLSFRSVETGFRPSAIEISFSAPPNFPLGEAQVSSGTSLMFTFCIALAAIDDRGAGIIESRLQLHVVIHRELVRVRAETQGVVFLLFQL